MIYLNKFFRDYNEAFLEYKKFQFWKKFFNYIFRIYLDIIIHKVSLIF